MKINYTQQGLKLGFIAFIALTSTATLSSCGKKKKKAEPVAVEKIDKAVEISLPFESKEYRTDKEFFRSKNVGKSPDLATAKKIAMQNAKAELAGNIQSTMKRVTDQYTNQRSVANKQEYENKFEEMSREVVNMSLTDVRIIGEKPFVNPDNSYSYWVAIEASKETVLKGFDKAISNDAKLKLDYDKMKFEQIFNEEMKKLEQGN